VLKKSERAFKKTATKTVVKEKKMSNSSCLKSRKRNGKKGGGETMRGTEEKGDKKQCGATAALHMYT
jgi:hypothetical protein